MKKIFVIVAAALLGIVSLLAQAPQKLTYQAVIRNGAGEVVSDQALDVQVSILQGSANGAAVYSETHNTSTTSNGVVTLEVGAGTSSDDFSSIDWSKGPFFINSSVDMNGKTISVTSQLLSVPYALYAQKASLAEKVNETYLTKMISDQIERSFAERDSIAAARADSIALADSIAAARADSIAAAIADSIAAARADSIAAAIADSIAAARADSIAAAKADSIAAASFKSAAKNGVLPGKFSISEDKQVHFSQGVLQYHEKNNVWRFAETQFDTLSKSYKDYWMSPTNAWVDLFEFGTGVDYPECPFETFPYWYGYESPVYNLGSSDWGLHPIVNGGNTENQWQTLSWTDWTYLFHQRNNAEELYSRIVVDGMKGYVILPDDWALPSGVSFSPRASDFTVNVYDKLAWSKMETAGAVFFPCSKYWSSDMDGSYLNLVVDRTDPIYYDDGWYDNDFVFYVCYCGRDLMFVRLATVDVSVADKIMSGETIAVDYSDTTGFIPNNYRPDENVDLSNVDMTAGLLSGKFSVSESKQVNFSKGNLQYNRDSKVWRFAENQYDKISVDGFWYSRDFEDGWTDRFNWASSGYSADPLRTFYYDEMYGLGSENIDGTKYDWGVNNPISNGGNTPNIWRTLTNEEWTYLLNRKKNGLELAVPAVVDNVDGWVLLPDDWSNSSDVVDVKHADMDLLNGYDINVYTLSQWSVLESQGAVFLPCAGIFNSFSYHDYIEYTRSSWTDGAYWSSSAKENDIAWIVDMGLSSYDEDFSSFTRAYYMVSLGMSLAYRTTECSVRLVRDVK